MAPTETTPLAHPIDVMSLIHKAIRAEARHTRRAAEQLEMGGGFKTFTQVFYRWAMALEYHEETEYQYVMPHLPRPRQRNTTKPGTEPSWMALKNCRCACMKSWAA